MLGMVTYFSILKTTLIRGVFIVILVMMRRVLKSMLFNGLFEEDVQYKIRKIAIFFLYIACFLMLVNFIYLVVAVSKGNWHLFRNSLLNFISIFEKYVITALIGFSIVEVFIAGMKLKKENDLTI